MTRSKLIYLTITAALVLLAACASNGVALTHDDNGKTIEVSPGGTFTITLESNPTTGFSWGIVSGEGGVIQLQGEPKFDSDSALIGAGGVEVFTFKAIQPGETTLEMNYRRPWETDVEPLDTYTVTIIVK